MKWYRRPIGSRNTNNKFGRTRTVCHGVWFDSKLEASVYAILKQRQDAGEISDLRCQHTVYLTKAEIGWRLDFSFQEAGELAFGEAKGMETPDYILKRRLWKHYGAGKLYIYKGSYQKPKLTETIIPQQTVD